MLCGARWPSLPQRLSCFLFLFVCLFVLPPACNPAKGRTNMELREKFILADGASQGMAAFRPRGRRSRPSSRGASPNRSTSVSSHACQAASPQVPAAATAVSTPKVGLQVWPSLPVHQSSTAYKQVFFLPLVFVGPAASICISSHRIFKYVLPNDP